MNIGFLHVETRLSPEFGQYVLLLGRSVWSQSETSRRQSRYQDRAANLGEIFSVLPLYLSNDMIVHLPLQPALYLQIKW
jgi:hypothetical protein